MCKISWYLLILSVSLSSCSYRQFGAAATGSSLGGMFGSSIGGLMGGARGADKGTLAGMIVGGAVGVAVTTPRTNVDKSNTREIESYSSNTSFDEEVKYGTYNSPRYSSPMAAASDLAYLQVQNVSFLDENDNECLDRDEKAYIVFDIKNTGLQMLYNITPQIICNSSRVVVSPPATIENLASGKGVRYKAMVHAYRRINKGSVRFSVVFGNGSQAVTAKTFTIRVR